MKKAANFLHMFNRLARAFLPLMFLQTITYTVLNIFHMVIQPLLMSSVFSALEAGEITQTISVCLRYAALLLLFLALSYWNNVILDLNLFEGIHHVTANTFMEWHKVRRDSMEEGEVFQTVTNGANSLLGVSLDFVNFLGVIGSLAFLVFFSSTAYSVLPWILAAIFGITAILNRLQVKVGSKRENRVQEALGQAEGEARQLFGEMNFLQRYGVFEKEQERYEQTRRKAWGAKFDKSLGNALVGIPMDLLLALAFAVFFAAVAFGIGTKDGEEPVTVAGLAMAVSLLQSVTGNVSTLWSNVGRLVGLLVPVDRLSALLEDQTSHEPLQETETALVIEGEEEICLREGETVAVIGHNGSGKTTLLKRIAGIPCQEKGARIRIYGRPPEQFSYENRRKCISVATKEEMLFSTQAGENILMNAEPEEYSDEEVLIKLARSVNAESFLSLEAGSLSGGQAKRINLLRACAHSTKILLADEPTASLDEENAKRAFALLRQSAKEKVLVVVTHDPESLKDFDRILIMEDLKPIFAGTYEEAKQSPAFERWRKAAV